MGRHIPGTTDTLRQADKSTMKLQVQTKPEVTVRTPWLRLQHPLGKTAGGCEVEHTVLLDMVEMVEMVTVEHSPGS